MTGYRYKSVKNLNKSVKVRGYLLLNGILLMVFLVKQDTMFVLTNLILLRMYVFMTGEGCHQLQIIPIWIDGDACGLYSFSEQLVMV